MKIQTMRILDFYLGSLLCALFSLGEKTYRIFFPVKTDTTVTEILVMKYFGLGSILLATPMLRAVRKKFSTAQITFLTFIPNREICERLDLADKYIYLDTGHFTTFCIDLIKTIVWFIRRHYDLVFDLEFFSKFTALVSYLTHAPVRVGYYVRNEPRTLLYTNPVYFNYYKHITEIYLALAREVGASCDNLTLNPIKIYPGEKEDLTRIINETKLDNTTKVVVNVNSGEMCPERRWPKEKFISLLNLLIPYPNLSFIFIGTAGEYGYVQKIIDGIDKQVKTLNLAGRTNLGHLYILLQSSGLFITNDSGPLHIAELTGTPTISFFGPETPVLYGPKGKKQTVVYKGIYCSPCLNVYNVKTAMYGNKRCWEGNNKCMYEITVDEVYSLIKQILDLSTV